jgi:hypothetical protein
METTTTEDEEIDPLDAYMSQITKETRPSVSSSANTDQNVPSLPKKARVVMVGAIEKSVPNKGDIMENEVCRFCLNF